MQGQQDLQGQQCGQAPKQKQMQPGAQPCVNDTDSPDNKNAQGRQTDTQQEDKQDDVKRRRLAEDKEFRGRENRSKEWLSNREIPHDKEVQAGKKKV